VQGFDVADGWGENSGIIDVPMMAGGRFADRIYGREEAKSPRMS